MFFFPLKINRLRLRFFLFQFAQSVTACCSVTMHPVTNNNQIAGTTTLQKAESNIFSFKNTNILKRRNLSLCSCSKMCGERGGGGWNSISGQPQHWGEGGTNNSYDRTNTYWGSIKTQVKKRMLEIKDNQESINNNENRNVL